MSVKKVVIAQGEYENQNKIILIGFDENDKAVDIIDLENTIVGVTDIACVEKVLNDFEGAFVKLKNLNQKGFIETKNINPEKFLVRHSQTKKICQCDEFYVLITQDKKDNKAANCVITDALVDCQFPFISYYCSNIADNDCRIIVDSALDLSFDFLFESYRDDLAPLWNLFDFTSILNKALADRVYLSNDGNIVLEKTEAMTVVDVNTGKGKKQKDFFETNLQAAKEVARQIRLRNISGMIVVDFLKNMNNTQKAQIISEIKVATKDDYSFVSVFDFTALGLLEITRSRKIAPLSQNFKNTMDNC